ncbi:TetR/AcrR family transcriptional regulator [Streptomyces sp. NPDC001948]
MALRQTCETCGEPVKSSGQGRPRRYCSRACQAKAYRARRAGTPDEALLDGDEASPLTVERIVRAGIAVADAEGLNALSMRGVADVLGAATMSLYRHVASKDDLVTLMVEAAMADVPLPESPPRNWRHGLERAAFRDWELYHLHPWILPRIIVSTRGGHSSAVAVDSESAFAAFDGLALEPVEAFRYMFMFASYVQGVALTYVSDLEAERRARTAGKQTTAPAHDPLSDPVAYPRLTRAMRAGADPWALDALFASGLAGVLDGIAADLARRGIEG